MNGGRRSTGSIKSGHLDIVLSNGQPDPTLILLNDGKGNFKVGGSYGLSGPLETPRPAT